MQAWLILYLSLHVCFTTLIHTVSNTRRDLDVPFHPPLPVFTQLGQPSQALCRCLPSPAQLSSSVTESAINPISEETLPKIFFRVLQKLYEKMTMLILCLNTFRYMFTSSSRSEEILPNHASLKVLQKMYEEMTMLLL